MHGKSAERLAAHSIKIASMVSRLSVKSSRISASLDNDGDPVVYIYIVPSGDPSRDDRYDFTFALYDHMSAHGFGPGGIVPISARVWYVDSKDI